MSAAFYRRMRGVADRLLTQYGQSIQLIDATRTTLDTYQGIKSPVRVENTPASVIEQSQATVYITAGTVTPDITNFLVINDETWKIIYIEPAEPTNLALLYTIFVSR